MEGGATARLLSGHRPAPASSPSGSQIPKRGIQAGGQGWGDLDISSLTVEERGGPRDSCFLKKRV